MNSIVEAFDPEDTVTIDLLGEASKKNPLIFGLLAQTKGGGLRGSEGPNMVNSFFLQNS